MEITLAIVVVVTVLLFGALISIGNERQRRTIDRLREQMALWAVQDLKIKRKHLEQTVQVNDPSGWLNNTASRVCGYDLKLQVHKMFDEPQTLICVTGDGSIKVIFSTFSPADIRRAKREKQNRLSRFMGHNPLLNLSKGALIHELSVLNSGHLFDLELSLVWKALTGQSFGSANSLWMYIIS